MLVLLLLASSSSTWSLSPPSLTYHQHEIDYSAANEYIAIHYEGWEETSYFGNDQQLETILDARNGYVGGNEEHQAPSLDSCGFQVIEKETTVTDWANLTHLESHYFAELRAAFHEAYTNQPIREIHFWNPMRRGASLHQTRKDRSTPTSGYAASPHIDVDVGAYTTEELVNLIEKNRVQEATPFSSSSLISSIDKGHRFAIVNAWRNIASEPVTSAPLALLSAHYNDVTKAFPDVAPDMDHSRWYVFSNLTPSELLLFCQYDRNVAKPSDVWHCALPAHASASERLSLDVRALVVFEERVTSRQDRYRPDRTRPRLSQKQSESFCSQQAARRRIATQ